jgi:hypothetical protein
MDGQVALVSVLEARMKLLHLLLEEGVEPVVLVPLFELLATVAAEGLGPDDELTMEADLGAMMCRAAAASAAMTESEMFAHARLLAALEERLAADDPIRREVADALAALGDPDPSRARVPSSTSA